MATNMNKGEKVMNALKTLGLVFLIFFVMAFACKDDNDSISNTNRGEQPITSSGSCSTKTEFLGIFKRDRLKSATTRNDLKQTEIIVNSFDVAAPITYSPVYNNKVVKIYPAYPVTVNHTSREFRFGKITESDYVGGLYYCYKNPEDYASKFIPEDDRFPKNACVCIAQNLEAMTSVYPVRECPYEEYEPNKICSGN